MEALARWAGYLAIVGGGLMVVVTVATTAAPDSPVWFVFFLVPILLGAAVLGLERRTRAATGQLGQTAAWLSAAGAFALLVGAAYSVASGEGTGSDYDVASDPLLAFWIATAGAWFLGNLGYAVALIRGGALSRPGAWLVVAGAVIAMVFIATLAQEPPPAAYLLFGIFGVGWAVIGYASVRPATPQAT